MLFFKDKPTSVEDELQSLYKTLTTSADRVNHTVELEIAFSCFDLIIDGYFEMLEYTDQEIKESHLIATHKSIRNSIKQLFLEKDDYINSVISRKYKSIIEYLNSMESKEQKILYLQEIYQKMIVNNKDHLTKCNMDHLLAWYEKLEHYIKKFSDPIILSDNDEIFYPRSIYHDFFKDWYQMSDAFSSSRNLEEKIDICETALLSLEKFVEYSKEYDNYVPRKIFCCEFLPKAYMRQCKWAHAERCILIGIRADAYDIDDGRNELDYLYQYKEIVSKAVKYIVDNPGCLQSKIYKQLSVDGDEKKMLMDFLKYSPILKKVPCGSTNELFIYHFNI